MGGREGVWGGNFFMSQLTLYHCCFQNKRASHVPPVRALAWR